MANLMDLLQGQLSEAVIGQLAQQIGGAKPDATKAATAGIMNTIMEALARNTASPEGASALTNALERDHDGSVLNDLSGMIQGQAAPQETPNRAVNGAGILEHIFGNKKGGIADMISKATGLDASQAGSLMEMLAPIVMATLGKTKQEKNLDQSGVSDLLQDSVQTNRQQNAKNPMLGIITKFLDKDGDGSITDDLMNIVGQTVLKNLFKK